MHSMPVDAHGWRHDTPEVHSTRDTSADFLQSLWDENHDLTVYDSFDVEREHADMLVDI